MKFRIRKRDGLWYVYFVYNVGLLGEYEVFMDKYSDLVEAHEVAMYVAGVDL